MKTENVAKTHRVEQRNLNGGERLYNGIVLPDEWPPRNMDPGSQLKNNPVRFRFYLSDGSLYAFWVSRDETGRSDGYIGAGGPGYTGHVDTVGRAALKALE